MYGDDARGTLGIMSSTVSRQQVALAMEDACAGHWDDSGAQERCPAFGQGVMTHGLHAALSAYLQHVKELLTLRERDGRERTVVSDAMEFMEEFDNDFLWRTLWESNNVYEEGRGTACHVAKKRSPPRRNRACCAVAHTSQDAHEHMTSTVSTLWLIASLYAVANLALYVFLYRRLVDRLNVELVRARCELAAPLVRPGGSRPPGWHTHRSLLLLLPAEVLEQSATVRKYVASLTSEV